MLPIPGQLKICSIIIAPENKPGNSNANKVIAGKIAFLMHAYK